MNRTLSSKRLLSFLESDLPPVCFGIICVLKNDGLLIKKHFTQSSIRAIINLLNRGNTHRMRYSQARHYRNNTEAGDVS